MNADLETRLRDALTDERYTLPGWDDAVERVGRGVRRRRRRQVALASAAAAVLVALPLLLGVAMFGSGGSSLPAASDSVVPWIGETVAQRWEVTRRSPRADAPSCTELTQLWTDGTGATRTVLIGNNGPERCTLTGRPAVSAFDTDSQQLVSLPVGELALPADPARQFPATLDPGEPARLELKTGGAECQPGRYTGVSLDIGDGSYMLNGFDPSCGFQMSAWYVQPPILNAPLTIRMSVAEPIHPGEVVDYHVVVVNGRDAPVDLDPCPQVRQSFGPSTGTWQLNCSPGRLPGHSQTVFEARITAPPEPGKYRLRWVLVFADGTVGIGDLATDGVDVQVTP